MKYRFTILCLLSVVALFLTPVAKSAIADRVSEAGEDLTLSPAVRYTTEATKRVALSGEIKEGRALYERAVESDSTYAPARYALAKMLLYTAADSAMMHARKAYEIDTTNHWYLSTYAQTALSAERYDEAMMLYKKLLKLQPRDLNSYRILAILYNRNKQPQKAIALLDSAELKAGRNSYLLALKRQILISTNQFDEAMRQTQAAVEEEPYSTEYRVAMAELYLGVGRDSLAEVEYVAAMRIDSTRLETLISYGNFLEKRGREGDYLSLMRLLMQCADLEMNDKIEMVKELFGNAKLYDKEYLKVGDLIRALMVQEPDNSRVVELQVRHLISLGMVEQALEYLKIHLADEPAKLGHYRNVISIERHINRVDSADYYLKRAIEIFPEESELQYERAYLLTTEKRYDEAVEIYRAELSRDGATDSLKSSMMGTIGDLYYQMAEASTDEKQQKKLRRESYKQYDKALRLRANNSLVLNNYAYFLSENGGDLHKALEMSRRSTELEVSNPTYLDTYGWILYRLGRFEEAKAILRQAFSFDRTENGEIALHFAEVLSVLDEMTMANFYWDRSLKSGMTEAQVAESKLRAESMKERFGKGVEAPSDQNSNDKKK